MVFMLRLISGLLIISIYRVNSTEVTTPSHNTTNGTPKDEPAPSTTEPLAVKYNTLAPYKVRTITDEDVENTVKPFKFAKETETNVTSLKLKKSEPYNTKLNNDFNRTHAGRSVDIDVDKFSTTVDNNAVYSSPDHKEYSKEEESFDSFRSTEDFRSLGNLGPLTTPKTPYFDKKFQETVESINKRIDSIPDPVFENSTSRNYSSDNYIEENEEESKPEYKPSDKIYNNNETFGETLHEKRTTLKYEKKYNISKTYEENTPNEETNELHKESLKITVNDDTANEVKQNPSTDKSTTIEYVKKPSSTERSDAAIISNRIEGDTTTTPLSILVSATTAKTNSRGSIKFSDYNKIKQETSSSPRSPASEQTVEENQVVPVLITAPIKEVSPSESSEMITTVKTKSIVPHDNQSTTVYIFMQPEDMKALKDLTTIRNEIEEVPKTSVASTPRAFQPIVTTLRASTVPTMYVEIKEDTTVFEPDERTTAVTSIPRGFSLPNSPEYSTQSSEINETTTLSPVVYEETTTEIVYSTVEPTAEVSPSTTTEFEASTTTEESVVTTSESPENSRETTTEFGGSTTASSETTTEIVKETTVIDLRSSKNMKYLETTEAFTTSEPSTFRPDTTTNIVTSTESPPETTTIINEITTQIKIETTTTDKTTTLPTITNEITPIYKEQTTEKVTKVIVDTTPTKTLLESEKTEEQTSQETKTTPTTSFGFVHINNIDKNHTTLTPDELKPNEVYTTPVGAEILENASSSTETSPDDSTSSGLDGPTSGSGTVVAIIISCVGGICLIALACLLIVMRNRQNRFNYGQRCRPVSLDDYSVDNVSVFNSVRRKAAIRGSKTSYGNPAFEDPVCLSHALNFPAISKFANNEEDVTAEFKDIPQIVARTSELPEGCETKNRYANVIPLPESRVFLNYVEGYPNSDYINANFVTGPKNIRKYYIACQAPMSNTVDDFWRMIWEQQCKVILMLTHLFESGIEKCFDYLPPSEVLDCHRLFGDYQVTLKKREVKEKYIISSIQLKNMVSNSWREVTHFWYMGWPEKGVPTEANSIIAFLIEARSYMKNNTIDKNIVKNGDLNGVAEVNPVVVHCSPGTGRTGAVITCDIAIRDFEQTRQVDIPKIVYRIRRDRAGAVQTRDQYAFIYKVIDLYATKLAGGNLESI